MYLFTLYINNIQFCFNDKKDFMQFITKLFHHCSNRKKLYDIIMDENIQKIELPTVQESLEMDFSKTNSDGQNRSQSILHSLITIMYVFGKIYDPYATYSEKLATSNKRNQNLEITEIDKLL